MLKEWSPTGHIDAVHEVLQRERIQRLSDALAVLAIITEERVQVCRDQILSLMSGRNLAHEEGYTKWRRWRKLWRVKCLTKNFTTPEVQSFSRERFQFFKSGNQKYKLIGTSPWPMGTYTGNPVDKLQTELSYNTLGRLSVSYIRVKALKMAIYQQCCDFGEEITFPHNRLESGCFFDCFLNCFLSCTDFIISKSLRFGVQIKLYAIVLVGFSWTGLWTVTLMTK